MKAGARMTARGEKDSQTEGIGREPVRRFSTKYIDIYTLENVTMKPITSNSK